MAQGVRPGLGCEYANIERYTYMHGCTYVVRQWHGVPDPGERRTCMHAYKHMYMYIYKCMHACIHTYVYPDPGERRTAKPNAISAAPRLAPAADSRFPRA